MRPRPGELVLQMAWLRARPAERRPPILVGVAVCVIIEAHFGGVFRLKPNLQIGEIGGVLKLLIGGDWTNKDGHALGAHDLHLGTGDDHLTGGKRLGAPELTLDSDETLR